MELEGGVRVTTGELSRGQPFRVCIHSIGDQDAEVWTSHQEDGMDAFLLAVRQAIRRGKWVRRDI